MEKKQGILLAFGELFLKSEGVRKIFIERLLNNAALFLRKEKVFFKIHKFRGRIMIETDNTLKAQKIIKKIFGISWYSEAIFFPEIKMKELTNFISQNYKDWMENKKTFALRVKIEKGIIKESKEEIIDKIAEKINKKVDLSKPDKEIFIEIRKGGTFIFFKKNKGLGGLPVSSGGKILNLISGGIDSPVVSFLLAKRGVENIWLHFHSFPISSKKSIEKIEDLAKKFTNYQFNLKVIFIPFYKAQNEIRIKTPAKYRVLLYRRLMFKMAEKLAKKENCLALATGESLGQVSSQTLGNLGIIESVIKIPVFRPLIGMDKEEIIKMAKKFKTYNTSIIPQEDCCTMFVPKKQTAKGCLEEVKEIEKKLNFPKIINQCLKEIEIKNY